ncbi:transmembrane protein 6/97 [Cladochytrium replicatum]|nr:transmembrane protein 6/97 [Cladochytrium replicatum]
MSLVRSFSKRPLDFALFLYMLQHIPVAMFIDAQGFFPNLYPPSFRSLIEFWVDISGDPYMATWVPMPLKPGWFRAFVLCEMTIQFPYFVFAAHHLWHDTIQSTKTLSLIYGSHVATTVFAILFDYWVNFDTLGKMTGTLGSNGIRSFTSSQVVFFITIYSIYLVFPLLLLARMTIWTDIPISTNKKTK